MTGMFDFGTEVHSTNFRGLEVQVSPASAEMAAEWEWMGAEKVWDVQYGGRHIGVMAKVGNRLVAEAFNRIEMDYISAGPVRNKEVAMRRIASQWR